MFFENWNFLGHEVLKLYFKCSKDSISWNIRALKYPFFNKELKFLVQNFHSQFFKQSIFEASEALKQWEGTISKKRRLFHWFSRNSELEATWISLIGWPHKTSSIYVHKVLYLRNLEGFTIIIQSNLVLKVTTFWSSQNFSLKVS